VASNCVSLAGGGVPDADEVVVAGRGEVFAIGREGNHDRKADVAEANAADSGESAFGQRFAVGTDAGRRVGLLGGTRAGATQEGQGTHQRQQTQNAGHESLLRCRSLQNRFAVTMRLS
jgi:hypothetical protein